jgi:hypothetical protein
MPAKTAEPSCDVTKERPAAYVKMMREAKAPMIRPRSLRHLVPMLGVLVLIGSACGSSASVEVPLWLKDNALSMKQRLGDPKAKISYVLGSYPIAIVHGHLTCGAGCIGPVPFVRARETYSVTGSTAAERYEGRTHKVTVFTVSKHGVKEIVRELCKNFGPRCASGGARG